MKLYAQEKHSDWTRLQLQSAGRKVASQITWVEMCAAFALKERTQQISAVQAAAGLARLGAEWALFTQLAIEATLIELAGNFARRFGLRAYDSVQLATAAQAANQVGTAMSFCCFDQQLNTAASSLGIQLLQP